MDNSCATQPSLAFTLTAQHIIIARIKWCNITCIICYSCIALSFHFTLYYHYTSDNLC